MSKTIYPGLLLVLFILTLNPYQPLQPVAAEVEPVIGDYISPCRFNTEGYVTTWHGMNQDGQPPYDPDRRTYDFRCVDKLIYAPHGGVVWGVTPRFGGVILIDDHSNNACIVFLGMHGFNVEPNEEVRTGHLLGFYGHAFHLTAVDGYCADANWYDTAARDRERPVAWAEFGEVIAPDIPKSDPIYFTSMNPGGSLKYFAQELTRLDLDLFD
ncbi:MAG: M23 family metallopeptidase [Chloroflexi bacterium]|nr:M23 family metallopeptidase [Chloroflexota bacterium]